MIAKFLAASFLIIISSLNVIDFLLVLINSAVESVKLREQIISAGMVADLALIETLSV